MFALEFTVTFEFDLRQIQNIADPINTKTSWNASSCCKGGRVEIGVSINKGDGFDGVPFVIIVAYFRICTRGGYDNRFRDREQIQPESYRG